MKQQHYHAALEAAPETNPPAPNPAADSKYSGHTGVPSLGLPDLIDHKPGHHWDCYTSHYVTVVVEWPEELELPVLVPPILPWMKLPNCARFCQGALDE